MSNFSIHLSEPLSDAEAKRVAQQTAPALGGNPEKLHLLLSKQPGSRIARASSQRQAETVAGILRNAGVKVEVLENADALPPVAKPPSLDPFASPSIPPLAPPTPEVLSPENPFTAASETIQSITEPLAPPSDPFAAFKAPDPFVAPKTADPFAAPKSDPFAAPRPASPDPFAAPRPASPDPFAAPRPGNSPDPFTTSSNADPFAAPKSDPFAAPKSNPFAAPVLRTRPEPEVTVNADPFAAPGTAVVIDTKATQTDLPAQARRARDRAIPRTSVRNQLLRALIVPYLLVAAAAVAFLFYQLPQIYREELGARAYQAALGEAEANYELIAKLPDPKTLGQLQTEAQDDLKQIPEAVAIIYEADVMEISGSNGALAAHASTLEMTAAEAVALEEQFVNIEAQNKTFGEVTFRGQRFIGSVADIEAEGEAASAQPIGEIHVLFSLEAIGQRVWQSMIPLFIALGLIAVFALFLANALASGIARPIIAATEQANRIALGDLDRSVNIESNDEIGDMLGSLERMRVSLKSMVARLRRNT
jgi:HAMP domain-containing protein